ncbi:hypothetical protein [Streptomyces sp. NPDC059009]|uniref:hypothetical protein n=1 Tax=Streptomyces sp. NPDC059009 TaxID=3346694 RepID=UPI0036C38F86
MLTTPEARRTNPTPSLLASLSVAQWVDATPNGHVAFLLVTHPPKADTADVGSCIEASMRGLASELGLAPPSSLMPDVSNRLSIARDCIMLSLAESRLTFCVSIRNTEWGDFVRGGGPVAIVVGLDPLSPTTERTEINEYLATGATADRLLVGKAQHQESVREGRES